MKNQNLFILVIAGIVFTMIFLYDCTPKKKKQEKSQTESFQKISSGDPATLEKNKLAYENCLKSVSRTFAAAVSEGRFPKAKEVICPE